MAKVCKGSLVWQGKVDEGQDKWRYVALHEIKEIFQIEIIILLSLKILKIHCLFIYPFDARKIFF